MTIGLMLTSSCNYQCRHCMVDSTTTLSKADDKVFQRFYDTVRYNRPDRVCIVGGEPLLFLDTVERIITDLRPYCGDFMVYSNGTFLLDDVKRERVRSLGVEVRISKTIYHKDFWSPEIEKLIDDSPYWKADVLDTYQRVFPRGRALENNLYTEQPCPCSLVDNEYTGKHHSNRFLIMQDGSVNIWCQCMSLELANVFTDGVVTHDLLVERECLLRTYLKSVNMFYDDMLFMCNDVCNHFRVTCDGIYRDDELMEKL